MFETDVEGGLDRRGNARLNGTIISDDFELRNMKIDKFESEAGVKIAVVYLPGVSSYSTIRIIESQIRGSNLSSAKEMQSHLMDSLNMTSSIFPLVRKTRKVQMARMALLKGGVLIFIDGIKCALVAPQNLGQSLLEIPRYLDSVCPIISKALNYIALFVSLFLSSLYIAVFSIPWSLLTSEIGHYMLNVRSTIIYPAIVEVLILEAIAELLREALWISPPKYGLAVYVFSSCAIGRMLLGWSIFSPILVLIVSTSLIISFLIPDYLTIHSLRILKLLTIIATGMLGINGFAFFLAFITINIIILARSGIPYSPWGWYELIHAFLRTARSAKYK